MDSDRFVGIVGLLSISVVVIPIVILGIIAFIGMST